MWFFAEWPTEDVLESTVFPVGLRYILQLRLCLGQLPKVGACCVFDEYFPLRSFPLMD